MIEYVRSVGATYRVAGAHRLALQLIYHWFRRRAAAKGGLPASTPANRIAEGLARGSVGKRRRYESVLKECEAALGLPRLSGHHGTALVRKLADIESEVFHGSSTGE